MIIVHSSGAGNKILWSVRFDHQLYFHYRFKKKTYGKTANLLTGKTDATQEEQDKANEWIKQEIFSHWHPNITVNLVVDYTNWAPGQVISYSWDLARPRQLYLIRSLYHMILKSNLV